MARGRDLKINILSDLDKFETDPAAKELENLGDAARDMGDDLDKTAKKVDDAFERIARSSRSSLRKVDDEANRAGKGMDDFKDEVDSTGREAAASFTGSMDDIVDAVQEVAANATAAFGPAGAIVGIAAAAGIGLIVSSLESAAEKANEAKENTAGLAQEIVDAGGNVDNVDLTTKIEEWSLAIADNKRWFEVWQKEAVTNLEQVQEKAEKVGIATGDMLAAMSGADAKATEQLLGDLKASYADLNDEIERKQGLGAMGGDMGPSDALLEEARNTEDLIGLIEQEIEKRQEAIDMANALTRARGYTNDELERAQGIYDSLDSSLDGHATVVEEAAKRAAIANGESASAWENYRDKATISLDDVNAAMQEQIAAITDFQANQKAVLEQVGADGIAAAEYMATEMGIPIEQAMQLIADAPKKKQQEIVSNWQTVQELAGQEAQTSLAKGMNANAGVVTDAAGRLIDNVEGILSKDIKIPTRVVNPDNTWAVRNSIVRDLSGISVPVTVYPAGNAVRQRI